MSAGAPKGAPGPLHRAGPGGGGGAGGRTGRRGAILLHGRGSSGLEMIDLARQVGLIDVALFAPDAPGRSWWPTSFLAPSAQMDPFLLPALAAVSHAVEEAQAEGIERANLTVIGFSQGGCLALEWTARHGSGIASAFGLSAGLVGTGDAAGGPLDDLYGHAQKTFDYAAALDGVTVRFSVHERDPHIPLRRARDSAGVMERLGAQTVLEIKPGAGHGLSEGDVSALRRDFAGA